MEYRLFLIDEENQYVINSNKFGVITDVNIGLLREISELILCEAEKNKIQSNRPETPIYRSHTTETNRTNSQGDIHIYVRKRYREKIIDSNRALLSFNKSYVLDDQILNKIESKVQKAFKLAPIDDFDELVKSQLSDLKSQYINAINNRKTNIVEELLKIYLGITEGYLNFMEPYGGGFSFEQARAEREAAFLGGWEQMRWLVSDVRILFEAAVQSNNLGIINRITGLPIKIHDWHFKRMTITCFKNLVGFLNFFTDFLKQKKFNRKSSFIYLSSPGNILRTCLIIISKLN